jgi:hypothetical protein
MKQIFFLLLLVFFFSGCKKDEILDISYLEGRWQCTHIHHPYYDNFEHLKDVEIFLTIKNNKLVYEAFGKKKTWWVIKSIRPGYARHSHLRIIDIGGEIHDFNFGIDKYGRLRGGVFLKSSDYVNEELHNEVDYPGKFGIKYQNLFLFKKV